MTTQIELDVRYPALSVTIEFLPPRARTNTLKYGTNGKDALECISRAYKGLPKGSKVVKCSVRLGEGWTYVNHEGKAVNMVSVSVLAHGYSFRSLEAFDQATNGQYPSDYPDSLKVV